MSNIRILALHAAAFCTLIIATMGAGTPARAQSVFANCAALDGHIFHRDHVSVVSSETNTITTLMGDDAISIDIKVSSGGAGSISGVVSIGGATIFSETLVFGGGGLGLGSTEMRAVSFDPPSDATNVSLNFNTLPFTSAEGFVEFSVSCSPGVSSTARSPATTTAVSATFATERVRRLLEERPDRARFVRKQLKALWGGSDMDDVALADSLTRANNRARPVRVAEAPTDSVLVGMSARDATLSAYAYDNDGDDAACGIDGDGAPSLSCLDVWSEAHYTRFNDDGDRDGNFSVVYVGADMHLTPWVVAGLLGQMDWMTDNMPVASTKIRSTGWMVGPYATMRLTPDLFFDVRAAWGRSDTDIATLGASGNYATQRWLAAAQLTGNFIVGDIRITPEASVEYIEERLDGISGTAGLTMPDQKVSLGRVRVGPEIATLVPLEDGMVIEPRVAFRGIWDFDPADTITIGNVSYGDTGLSSVVEGGAILHGLDGINLSLTGKYEGIGLNGFQAYGGSLWVNVPL
jgi:hypothetical protein